MPFHKSPGDAIRGQKIICEFEERTWIHNKDDHKKSNIKGNLAKAVVVKTWKIVE